MRRTLGPVSWRFARRPLWILSHLLVLALVVAMVILGLWQLRRLDDRQALIEMLEARQREPVADVRDVVPDGAEIGDEAIEDLRYRTVQATGTYEPDDGVIVPNRSYEGTPGGWVLTPLRLDDGTAVVVHRGFIGFDRSGDLIAPDPPEGEVTVQGLVYPSEQRGRFGPVDPPEGRLDQLARADVERLDAQVSYDLLPLYVQLERSEPAEPAANPTALSEIPPLVALGAPEVDEGPHLSYAVQWFIFSTIAVLGYPLVLRRVALQEGRERRTLDLDRPSTEPDDLDRELEDLLKDP